MSSPKFTWIIRSWCSLDSFWEHVREHKEYDIAYIKPELVLEEIERIVLKEQTDWNDICLTSGADSKEKEFVIAIPSLEQIQTRPFVQFLTITSSKKDDSMQSWYVERLKIVES